MSLKIFGAKGSSRMKLAWCATR